MFVFEQMIILSDDKLIYYEIIGNCFYVSLVETLQIVLNIFSMKKFEAVGRSLRIYLRLPFLTETFAFSTCYSIHTGNELTFK